MSITIKNLNMEYKKGIYALKDLSLDINSGMFGLLGKNGAGKTTLMRILTTLIDPVYGEVCINGIQLNNKNKQKIKSMMGYLPQDFGMYPNLTVYEAIDYMGILYKMTKKKRMYVIDELLNKVNLYSEKNKKVKNLSGGMKRRLGLVQAMMNSPKVIVIDEPTAGLDPEERIRIRNLLTDFGRDKIIILSTHIVEDIASTCNNIAILENGMLKYNGNVKNLIESAKGKVWKYNLENNVKLADFKKEYKVLTSIHMTDSVEVKFLSDIKPDIECKNIEPNIEDSYMIMTGGCQIL